MQQKSDTGIENLDKRKVALPRDQQLQLQSLL